jgi:8-oxo-dGTP diphosphatase
METERLLGVMLVIITDDRRLLMHLRDDFPHIDHPGTWAGFGGATEDGETADEAIRREVLEETGIELVGAERITEIIDVEGSGRYVTMYVVRGGIEPADIDLQEGAGIGVLSLAELREQRVPPFVARFIDEHLAHQLA